ncbi:MAG: hypothetical protein PHT69_13405 [Bacteroidales bacterium]|nr:hypothetical protein [Bacteroidales bacterium]
MGNRTLRITSFFIKRRLKLVYLLFFIVPITYYFLWRNQPEKLSENALHRDYLSFSVRSSNAARLSLVDNNLEIFTWDINSKGYKNLEFVGPLKSSEGIHFKVNNLNINDTLSFLGINLYSNNKLFSLSDNIKQNISVDNARITEKDGVLILIVEKNGDLVNINIKPPPEWGKNSPFNTKKIIIALVFLIVFLSIFLFNPSSRYFVLALIISVFVLFFTYFLDFNLNQSVAIFTSSKIKNAEVFYNRSPFFSTTKKYISDKTTDYFSQPLNFETEKYLRFDIGDSLINLKQIKIKISTGVFFKTYNLSALPQGRLMLNDLVLIDNTYHVTGNDPYIKIISNYFVNNLNLLIFLEHNKFLFLTLIVFFILIGLNRWLDKKLNKLELKPAYLTFLIIPFVYYQIYQSWIKRDVSENHDYVYLSARTSQPSVFTLLNGSDSLTSWTVDSKGFKYLQFKGQLNTNENIFLKLSNLSINDTVSILSINLFHDNETYSLFEKNKTVCKINNADFIDKTNDFNAIVEKQGAPVIINLLPTNLLKKNNLENNSHALVILIVFFTFIFILIFSPNQRFFIISSLVASIMMFLFFWIGHDSQSQLRLFTSSPVKRVDFFYNDNPGFIPRRTYLNLINRHIFKFQTELNDFKFYRCDLGENNEKIKDLSITSKTGILSNSWDYTTISSNEILLNDLIRCGKDYQVCGNDPFIALSSAVQVNKMQRNFSIRQNLFFFLSILLILILIILGKHYKKDKFSNFFLLVFFLVYIFTGLIIHLFNSENLVLLAENRSTSKLPAFQIDSSTVYTKGLDDYILDQLPGRKYIISINNLIQYAVFKQLLNNQSIHFGKDGWLFYIGGPARENFENRHPLKPDELLKITNVLLERRNWLKERNIEFYMIFPPMPQSIYEEFVGPRLRHYDKQTKSEQLFEYLKLNTDLNVIDVYTPLIKVKNSGTIKPYYKNNCHWNFKGGYVAYCAMINYIKKKFPDVGEPLTTKDYKWVIKDDFKPDLLRLLDIDKFYSFQEYVPSFYENIITDTIYPFYLDLWTPAPPASILTKRTSAPTMLIYGDSYAAGLLKFLFCNFSKSTFVWTPLFHPDIIEIEKPDMVIQEMVDVSIVNILLKNKPFPELKDTIPENPE